jgi:hypothetical protein
MTKIENMRTEEAQKVIDRFMSETKDWNLYQKAERMYHTVVRHQRLISALHRAGRIDRARFIFKVYVVDEYIKAFAMRLREIECEG